MKCIMKLTHVLDIFHHSICINLPSAMSGSKVLLQVITMTKRVLKCYLASEKYTTIIIFYMNLESEIMMTDASP
jgi:hypothetical protein